MAHLLLQKRPMGGSQDLAVRPYSLDDQSSSRHTYVDVEDVYKSSSELPLELPRERSSVRKPLETNGDPNRVSKATEDDMTADTVEGTEQDFDGYEEFEFDNLNKATNVETKREGVGLTPNIRAVRTDSAASSSRTSRIKTPSQPLSSSDEQAIGDELLKDKKALRQTLASFLAANEPRAVKDGRLKALVRWTQKRGVQKLRAALKEQYPGSIDFFALAKDELETKNGARPAVEEKEPKASTPSANRFKVGSIKVALFGNS